MTKFQQMQEMRRATRRPLPPKAPLPQAGFGSPYYAAQAGLGSPMQRGQGRAYREGSLGFDLNLSNNNLIYLAIGGIAGLICVKKGFLKKGFLGT